MSTSTVTAPRFADLLRGERTKLTSLRSTWWCLAALTVLGLGFNALVPALISGGWNTMDPASRERFRSDALGLVLQPGAEWAQIAACVLGALLFASEFSTGTIRSTVLATPLRTPVLAAKAAVFAAVLFTTGVLIAIPSLLLGSELVSAHASLDLASWTTQRALLGFGVYLALTGVLALGVGALVRHTAGAVATILALQFVVPAAFQFLPGTVGRHLAQALPAAANVMLGSGRDADSVYSPLQGLLILVVWAGVAYAAAHLSLKKRNV
ncbi:ABC transporter permease [Streptacidiphilus anmyonensis]|uniref:ABC transporter permease n=1 Tax=Streptacidiphilus anmyonensis TaxID=405782 RepID=UPI0005A8DE1D|nr:ABC transporter permease [Streptacidiphilus anmyonensis]